MSSLAASLSNSINSIWLCMDPIRVGLMPLTPQSPDRYVTVTENGQPRLRIDVYSCNLDCFAFEEVITWRELVLIGFGSHVHAISVADRSIVTVEMGSYFGHFYPSRDFVLLASAERLFRLEPDRSVSWKSHCLGIDGVVVHEVAANVIRGEGEWDPPGGWEPFAVSVADGSPAR